MCSAFGCGWERGRIKGVEGGGGTFAPVDMLWVLSRGGERGCVGLGGFALEEGTRERGEGEEMMGEKRALVLSR